MLYDEEIFHATRDGFLYISDIERIEVEQMSSTVSQTAISAMLESLDRDQQHAAIAKCNQYELVAERESVALLQQYIDRLSS